jgi:hypothetical protein
VACPLRTGAYRPGCSTVAVWQSSSGSYRGEDFAKTTYSPLRFTPILVTPCGYTSGANERSLSLGEASLYARSLRLGKMSREKLPEQVRKRSPTSRDSGAARVSVSGSRTSKEIHGK